MTEEYVYEREVELLDYIRNNLTDPDSRGVNITGEAHVGITGTTSIKLNNNKVKNVSLVTVNSVDLRRGYDYTIEYGEGAEPSYLILNSALPASQTVEIDYHFGESMVVREFARDDATLPRVILSFLTGSEEAAALGDAVEYGSGSYFNASYRVEVRSKYASQARRLTSQAFNLGQKLRHADAFRTNITSSVDLQNFDYDIEKDCYIWQFTLQIQWEIKFA